MVISPVIYTFNVPTADVINEFNLDGILSVDYFEEYEPMNSLKDCKIATLPFRQTPVIRAQSTMSENDLYQTLLAETASISMTYVKEFIPTVNSPLLDVANLNGGSALAGNRCAFSEYLCYETLNSAFGAHHIRGECEIQYRDHNGKKTDMIVQIRDTLVAVSVTRAMEIRTDYGNLPFDRTRGRELLLRKLSGISAANTNVDTLIKNNRWYHHILFIWCESERIASLLLDIMHTIPLDKRVSVMFCVNSPHLGGQLY